MNLQIEILKPLKKVTFKKENRIWYFDYPGWLLSKSSLSMISGSDILLDILSNGKDEITLEVSFQKHPLPYNEDRIIELHKDSGSIMSGYNYRIRFATWTIYLCPVTLARFGYFPEYIYIILPKDVDYKNICDLFQE